MKYYNRYENSQQKPLFNFSNYHSNCACALDCNAIYNGGKLGIYRLSRCIYTNIRHRSNHKFNTAKNKEPQTANFISFISRISSLFAVGRAGGGSF